MWTPCGNWTEWGVPVREEGRACDVSLFESQHHLSQMIRQVIGSTQQDSQSVPGRVFGIVFLSHGAVLQQPLVRGKILQLREQLLVHFVPILFQLSCRRYFCHREVGIVYEYGIQIWMQPGTQAENRKHSVVNGNEMSPQVNDTVLSRCYLPQELVFSQS